MLIVIQNSYMYSRPTSICTRGTKCATLPHHNVPREGPTREQEGKENALKRRGRIDRAREKDEERREKKGGTVQTGGRRYS